MKRLTLVVAAAMVAACGKSPDAALKVPLHVSPALEADCVELVVSAGGAPRKSLLLARTEMKESWVFGVLRGDDLPQTVTLQARGLLGRCDDAASLKLNARSAEVEVSFPRQGVQQVQLLQLDPPSASLDADRDGYVARAQGGVDCDDAAVGTFPGAAQRCDSLADTDCDGLGGCDDPDCASSGECARSPDRLSLAGVPATPLRARCEGPVTVELRDALGRRAAVRPTAVRLATSGAGLSVFSDAACTVAVDRLTIPFQAEGASVYVRGDVAGRAALTVTSDGLLPASAELDIAPWQPAALAFTSPPRALTAGRCAMNEMTVELRDAQGRPTTATADLVVSLEAAPNDAEGNFFTAADCALSSATTTVPMAAGSGRVSVRVRARRATSAGAPLRVTARADVGAAMPLTATQDVTVAPALATKLAFLNAPLAIPAGGACSATPGDVRLKVEVRDEYGNRAPAPRTTALTIGGIAGVTFHDAAQGDCSVPVASVPLLVGAAQVDFFLKGAAATQGLVTVNEVTGALAEVAQPLVVTGGTPAKVVWDMNPRTAVSNQCTPAPLVLGVYDAANSPASFAAPQPIALSTLPSVAGLSFFTAAGCPPGALVTGPVSFPAGATQLPLYFQGATAVSAFTVRATPTDATITGSDLAGNAIVAGAPASLRFTPAGGTAQAGACAGPFTVGLFDAANNPAFFTADVDLSFTAASGSVTWGSTPASCSGTAPIALGRQGSVPVYFSGTVARSYTLTAVTTAMVSSSNTAALTVTPGPSAGLARIEPAQADQTLTAGTCLRVTVTRRDAFGNDVPVGAPATLTFSALPTGVTLHPDLPSCTAKSSAASTFPLTASDVGRVFYVRAEKTLTAAPLTATLLGQSTSLSLTVVPAAAASIAFAGLPATRQSGECLASVTLLRRDVFGNNVTNGPTLTATVSGAGVRAYTSPSCSGAPSSPLSVTFAAGSATSPSFSLDGLTVGSYPVLASAGALTDTKSLTVTPGAANKLVITTPGGAVTAGACVDVTAQVRDLNDNAVAGTVNVTMGALPSTGVTVYGQAGCMGSPQSMRSTSGTATATFSFRATTVAPSLVLSASATGLTTGTQTYAVGPGSPAKLAWKSPPPLMPARFACSAAATVELRDAQDNVSPASSPTAVTLTSSASAAGLTFFSDATCMTSVTAITIPAGATEANVYLVATGTGSTNVTGSSVMLTATPAAPVTPSGAVTGSLVVTPASLDVEPGACVTVTVARQTSGGAAITLGRSAFSLSSNDSAVGLFTASDCSGAASASVSGTIATGTSATTVYARGRSTSSQLSVTLTATETNGGLTAGSVMVRAYPLVRRGTCAFGDMESSRRCVLSPAIPGNDVSRSMLVFSSSGDNTTPSDGNVQCRLDKTTDVAVLCTRGGNTSALLVDYQVVSWGRGVASGGVSVRHLSGTFASGVSTLDVPLMPALTSLGSSFLLFSTSSASGPLNNETHFPTARIVDASTVRLQRVTSTSALTYSLQVVEYAGATVQRGLVSNQSGTSFTVGSLPTQLMLRSFILYSARTDSSSNDDQYTCKRRLRARHDSTTQMTFTRGAGGGGAGSNCSNSSVAELAWERVTLPDCGGGPCSTVQHPADVTLNDGFNSGTVTFGTAIETHRAIVLFAGQGPGGQSAGEGNYNGTDPSTGDNTGPLHGRPTFTDSSTVRVDRALSRDKAVFAPQVIQFEP